MSDLDVERLFRDVYLPAFIGKVGDLGITVADGKEDEAAIKVLADKLAAMSSDDLNAAMNVAPASRPRRD